MRKRSASESSQGHHTSQPLPHLSGKLRKNLSTNSLKRQRRKSQNSADKFSKLLPNLSKNSLPGILDDWKIIVQSMKQNQSNMQDRYRSLASDVSHVQENGIGEIPLLPKAASEGSVLKKKVKRTPKKEHIPKSAKKESQTIIPEKRSSLNVKSDDHGNDIDRKEKIFLPTAIISDHANGHCSPSDSDSNCRDDESDFVGFGTSIKGKVTENITSTSEVDVKKPEDVSLSQNIKQKSVVPFENSISDELETIFCKSNDDSSEFLGFESISDDCKHCNMCNLSFTSDASYFHHKRFGHLRIYCCPFDYGECGQFKGSVNLHIHLIKSHLHLYDFIAKSFITDVKTCKVNKFIDLDQPCSVCKILLQQPEHCFHELMVHGIFPKYALDFSSMCIEQVVNLWWTGEAISYDCKLCHLRKCDTPYQACSVLQFPSSVQRHLAQHDIAISNMQGWWLLMRLVLSVPVNIRRCLNSLLCIGSEKFYNMCLLCKTKVMPSSRFLSGICSSCNKKILEDNCWFNCSDVSSSVLDHNISEHSFDITFSGFCVKCGDYVTNVLVHSKICSDSKECKFCKEDLRGCSESQVIGHSLRLHSFQCPLAGCMMPFTDCAHPIFHRVLPLSDQLVSHILTKHLPNFQQLSQQEAYSTLLSAERGQSVITLTTLPHIWIGIGGSKYKMTMGELVKLENFEIRIKCSVCQNTERSWIFSDTKSVPSVCQNCRVNLFPCTSGDFLSQCPVHNCLEKVISEEDLIRHLREQHGLEQENKHLTCELCTTYHCAQLKYKSVLQLLVHKLLIHRYACLICPHYSASEIEANRHLQVEHLIPDRQTDSNVWLTCKILGDFFKARNVETVSSKKKNPGISIVWSDSKYLYAGWEEGNEELSVNSYASMPKLVGNPEGTRVKDEDWCSTVCSVSMTGNKNTPASQSVNDEIKRETSLETLENPKLPFSEKNVLLSMHKNIDRTRDENDSISFSGTSITADIVKQSLPSQSLVGTADYGPKYKKRKVLKDMGENACIDENLVGTNILMDLEQNYSGCCTTCGVNVSLLSLDDHLKENHPLCEVKCYCSFQGKLNSYLVHSFHKSHTPCEASPIALCKPGLKDNDALIVLEKRPKNGSKSKFPCYKCNKLFSSEKSRLLHYNLCKLEKKFECNECLQTFGLASHLKKHKEWKHNPQKCEQCSKEFTSSTALHQHMVHIHKAENNHKCNVCHESFSAISKLKSHLKEHNLTSSPSVGISSPRLSTNSGETTTPSRRKRQPNKFNDDFVYTDSPRIHRQKEMNSSSNRSYPSDLASHVSSPSNKPKSGLKKVVKQAKVPSSSSSNREQHIVTQLPSLRSNIKKKHLLKIGNFCKPCAQEFDAPVAKLLHMYLLHPAMVLSVGFFQCVFCSYNFRDPDDVSDHHLAKHQRQIQADNSFNCLCGMHFKEDGAYYFHLYYAHKAQRALNVGGNIVCRVCPNRPKLDKIVDLVVHLSDRHTMFDHVRYNDAYMCNFCYKTFENWTVLSLHFFIYHKATKTQTFSYDCPYCEGASPWHSLEALQYHLDGVHGGQYKKAQTVPEHSRNIYTPAPLPVSPTKVVQQPRIPRLKIKTPAKHTSNTYKISSQKTELYCYCQSHYDETTDMIGCDNSECRYQWYHFECVGIKTAPAGSWFCPDCESSMQHSRNSFAKTTASAYAAPVQVSYGSSDPLHGNRHRNYSSSSSGSSSSSSSSSSDSSSSDSSSESDDN